VKPRHGQGGTYGTGCFAILNTGSIAMQFAQSAAHHHRLISSNGPAHLMRWKGSIFIAGAAVQWGCVMACA